jgi:hypothetical protein
MSVCFWNQGLQGQEHVVLSSQPPKTSIDKSCPSIK